MCFFPTFLFFQLSAFLIFLLYHTCPLFSIYPAFNSKSHRKSNYFTSKTLSETERLRLQLAKLEVENERLKKGYLVKGVGANKEFVSLKDVNMK